MHQKKSGIKALRIGVIGSIMVLTLYIAIMVSSLFLGESLSTNLSSLTSDVITKFANSVFCSTSTTMKYSLSGGTNENNNTLLLSSICSPFVQYVQAKSGSIDTDTASSSTDESLQIYDQNMLSHNTEDNSDLSDSTTLTQADSNIYSDIYFEDEDDTDAETTLSEHTLSGNAYEILQNNKLMISTLKEKLSLDYLIQNFYKVNSTAGIDSSVFNVKKLLSKDLTISKNADEPQILIFHTHAYETFIDSREGNEDDTTSGVGAELTKQLEAYGYNVIHYAKVYHSKTAYSEALPELESILKEHPSIQIVIDLHRDGLNLKNKTHTTVTVDGVKMAKLMFFNGVSHTNKSAIGSLYNKNLQTNLAFGLQMKLYAMEQYPELTKKNFIKPYRFNMHVVGRYSLVEVGDNNNTVAEAKAAMKPLADIINYTLTTKNQYNK